MFVRKRPCLGFTALILCAGALVIVHRSTRIGNQILCVNEENTLGAGDGFQSTIKMHICGPVYPSFKDNATRHYLQNDNKRTKKETFEMTNTLKESNDHNKTLKDDGIDEKAKNNGLSNVLKVNRVQFVKVKHKGSQEDKVITSAKQGNIQKDDQSTSQRVKHKENPKGDKENARKTNQQKLYKSKVNTTTLINSHSKEHSVDVNDVLHKTRNASPTNPQSELRPKRKQEGEIRQIVFAKIHKAASSTLQNLLLRFAMARNLNVLLPTRQDHINEFGSYIDEKEIIAHPENKPFDVLCNHLVFNANEIARFIPNSAFRFGILREPLSQTISAVQYYATHFLSQGNQMLTAALKYKTDPIQGFLNHPHDF